MRNVRAGPGKWGGGAAEQGGAGGRARQAEGGGVKNSKPFTAIRDLFNCLSVAINGNLTAINWH